MVEAMFSWGGSTSANQGGGTERYPSSVSKYKTTDEDVFEASLPPTLPVVSATIDHISTVAAKQRVFIAQHADKIKLELVKERNDPSTAVGEWALCGFALAEEDAVDFVRQSPDSLSNMTYVAYKDTSLWTKLTSWLQFGNAERGSPNALNLADDLGFVLAVAECIEVCGHVLGIVSHALTVQAPRVGKPLRRQLAFELTKSTHRGSSHSMYMMANVTHETQNAASSRKVSTLKVDLALYIYEPRFLGGVTGVAVNVSGTRSDDVPTADVEAAEIRRILAKRGTFVSSAVSDFVLDPRENTTSERASKITVLSSEKLINAANAALGAFFDVEVEQLSAYREQVRARAAEEKARLEREAEAAAAAEAERERREALNREPLETGVRGGYGVYPDEDDYARMVGPPRGYLYR